MSYPLVNVVYHYPNGGTRTRSMALYTFGSEALRELHRQVRGTMGNQASYAWHGHQYAVFHDSCNGGNSFYTVNTMVGGSSGVEMKDAKRDDYGVLHVTLA